MGSLRGVLFDYGLVLSGPPDAAAWDRLKTLFSASEESFHAAYWRPRHEYDRGALNVEPYWRTVTAELNQSFTPDLLRGAAQADVEMWTQPNREMIDWAAALQANGIVTAILSNLGDAMEAGLRERCAWLSGFAHLTFSHRLGTAKPDPAIYKHAAEGMALDPAEILFVDDREENIAAAQAFGMHAMLYLDHTQFVGELRASGVEGLPLPATR